MHLLGGEGVPAYIKSPPNEWALKKHLRFDFMLLLGNNEDN